jgi:hypothetical protein
MSDAVSFAEIAGQQVELLPARTVLSLFNLGGGGAHGGTGGDGGQGRGGIGLNVLNIDAFGDQINSAGDGNGGAGGDANGGAGGNRHS